MPKRRRSSTSPLSNGSTWSQNLHMPKDGKRYKARKMQALLREMEKQPPSKINIKEFILLLNAFVDMTDEINKEMKQRGISKKHGKSKVQSASDAGTLKDQSSDVGDDISAEDKNPFEGVQAV